MTAPAAGRERVTFLVLAVSIGAFSMLQSLLVPVLAEIERHFDSDQQTVTWVLTAYLLSSSILTPLLGRFGDMVGKRRILVVTLALLTVGSLLAALAPTLGVLILARVIQGAGGGVMPLAFGIVRDEMDAHRVGGAVSILAALSALGYGAGIVASGPIVEHLGYAWLFWLPMVVTALAGVAAVLVIPDSPTGEKGRLPWGPALLLAVWLVCLLLAVSQGGSWGWTSARVLGLLAAAVLGAAGWVMVETRVRVPMIDMRMMRRRGVWSSNVVAALLGFGMFAGLGFVPQLMQTPPEVGYGFGASITESGRLLLPCALAMFVVGFLTSRLVHAFGSRLVTAAGCVTGAASYIAIAFIHDQPWQTCLFMTTLGFGIGTVFSTLAGVVVRSVPAEQTSAASGMNANIRTLGGSIGAAVMAGVVTAHTGVRNFPAESGYTLGFVVIGLALAVAAVAAWWIPAGSVDPPRVVSGKGPLSIAASSKSARVEQSRAGPTAARERTMITEPTSP